ncbi:MAG: isoprenylcysteine carboxylmethyltransferase family protein [Pseudomonadota bacterium]
METSFFGLERTRDRRAWRVALLYGALCHGIFALAGLAMVWGLYTGLTRTFGTVPWPWAALTNALLLVQFPLGHSLLLTSRGRALLTRLAPAPYGETLATTTYATIASVQLLLLFALWTPSGLVVWQAEGWAFWAMSVLFAASWALLTKASFDAGPEVQSGALGWWALARGQRPVFPPMPVTGLFRIVRQPIYVSFALVLWTMPVWTVDQLVLAIAYTAYCMVAPRWKERRFERLFGAEFEAYRARVPYWVPIPRRKPRVEAEHG